MQNLTLRPLIIYQDLPALADLLNSVRIQKTTAERLHEWEVNRPQDGLRRTMVADAADGSFAGYSLVFHQPGAENGRYYVDVAVTPSHHRQGLGALLYEDAYQFALANGVRILDADVYDNCPYCLQFAEKREFAINRHFFESHLDLQSFDPQPFDDLVREVKAGGIRLFSLADGGDTKSLRRQLYDVNYLVSLDSPGSHGTFPSYEAFSGFVFSASWFLPEGQILAADGDKVIGLTAVGYFADQDLMENMITGVLPTYRDRKIAQALKTVALTFAKKYGASTIRTHNDSQNEPMLAINRKFGYKPQVGEYQLINRLTNEAS